MHRCLRLQEILSNIFDYIYWEYHDVGGNRDIDDPPRLNMHCLATLAVTCKAFYEPAITVLWSYQTSLVPLMQCLPGDAYRERGSIVYISRDLLPSDFDRIVFYAQKIKHLDGARPNDGECSLSPQAIVTLLLQRPNSEPLLPNLCYLTLKEVDFEDAAVYPRLIVGPRLKSVRLLIEGKGDSEDSWDNIKTILLPFAPVLELFAIYDFTYRDYHNPKFYRNLIQLFANFRDLGHLLVRVIRLKNDDLTRISTLPMLQHLNLCIDDLELSSLCQLSFDRLTTLSLFTLDFKNIATFLSSTSFKILDDIRIQRDRSLNQSCQIMFEAFSNYLQDCPLDSIELDLSFGHGDPTPMTRNDFKPLFVFSHISTLIIDCCSTIYLDDALLVEMSKAWPKLRNLQLRDNKEYDIEQRPSFTPAGVITFARSCPDLKLLTLSFNAEMTPDFAIFDDPSSIPSHIRQLDICRSPVSHDINSVAQWLILAFPELQELHLNGIEHNYCECESHPEADSRWLEVDSILKDLMSKRDCLQ